MAKNAKFKDVYIVTVEGITTNGFMSRVMQHAITNALPHLSTKQVKVSVRKK